MNASAVAKKLKSFFGVIPNCLAPDEPTALMTLETAILLVGIKTQLENSPSGLWRALGKRVGCKPSGVRIPHSPQMNKPPLRGFIHLLDLSRVDSNVRWGPIGVAKRRLWGPFSAQMRNAPDFHQGHFD